MNKFMQTRLVLLLTPLLLSATYQVKTGDSLSKIAEGQMGKMSMWRDLWKLNQPNIANPDLIFPGQQLRLLDSDQIDFFESRQVAQNGSGGSTSARKNGKHRSAEWMLLPPQAWDQIGRTMPASADRLGFDRRNKIASKFINKMPVRAIIASDRIPIIGQITASRSAHTQIFMGEQVFIRADEQMQVGDIYSITTPPERTQSKRDGRIGFTYLILGKLKVIGVRDGAFIGTIMDLQHPIERDQLLIAEVKPLLIPKAMPSSGLIQGSILHDPHDVMNHPGDQHLVFLDVGSSDGVTSGTVFRHYMHQDPLTGKEISSKDFLIEADLLVLSVQEQFSTALVLSSRGTLSKDVAVNSLTDISDLNNAMGMQVLIQDSAPVQAPDMLDQLDQSQGIGESEEKELRQLENWVQTPEDIKREYIHQDQKVPLELGAEPAPNDGSDASPQEKGEAPVPNVLPPDEAALDSQPDLPPDEPVQLEGTTDDPGAGPVEAPPPPPEESEKNRAKSTDALLDPKADSLPASLPAKKESDEFQLDEPVDEGKMKVDSLRVSDPPNAIIPDDVTSVLPP